MAWICALPLTEAKSLKTNKTNRAARVSVNPPATRSTGNYILRLFVAGATARSRQAILRVRQLCAAELKNNCQLEVIDIYQQPRLARENQIVATPTLIKEFPRPMRRFIGNFSSTIGLFAELDVAEKTKIAM